MLRTRPMPYHLIYRLELYECRVHSTEEALTPP
jgi:hypothetical protein